MNESHLGRNVKLKVNNVTENSSTHMLNMRADRILKAIFRELIDMDDFRFSRSPTSARNLVKLGNSVSAFPVTVCGMTSI